MRIGLLPLMVILEIDIGNFLSVRTTCLRTVERAIRAIGVLVLLTQSVNVIGMPDLLDLAKKHPQSEQELLRWFKVARSADWACLLDVRHSYASADLVGQVLIFNILNNQLRLITVVSWRSKRIYIKALLTHKQYDRKEWMKWAR